MKRLVTMILAIMLLTSLAACGGSTADTKDAEISHAQKETNASNQKEENVQKNDADQSDITSGSKVDDKKAEEKEAEEKKEISISEIVVVDNDECSIKLTGIDPDNSSGYVIKTQLENKSEEKTYVFSVQSASINGVQCDTLFYRWVSPGKKAKEEILFFDSMLKEADVGEYTDIELSFLVYVEDDYSCQVAKETVHVYPYGEENAASFVRETQPTDTVLIDNEYVSVIVTRYEQNPGWEYTVNLFCLNKTDKKIVFKAEEVSVNGYMTDPGGGMGTLEAGKSYFSSMSWSAGKLEEIDVTTVEEIEFKLRVYDYENSHGEDFANEVITLNP